MDHRDHKHCCANNISTSSVYQTINELEFERGIWSAALNGEEDKIVQHIVRGVNPNTPDSSGYTPLHYASRNGHLQCCKILLENGADPNISTKSGSSTALHRSAMKGHSNIVNILIQYKAKPNCCDADGKTPLHKAAEGGHIVICKTLISCCPSAKDSIDNKNKKPVDYVPLDNTTLLGLFS